MEKNYKKQLKIETATGETQYLTEQTYQSLKNMPRYAALRHIGYEQPKNTLPCWWVEDSERRSALKQQRKFHETYPANCYFHIENRIDNFFLEGFLGRVEDKEAFLSRPQNNIIFFRDYENRQPVYFTFDQVNLYQLVEYFHEDPIRFILKRIDNPKVIKHNQAFMIMPFHDEQLELFYKNHLRDYLKRELRIEVYRADDFRDNDIIIETIYKLIEESEFIIAETTLNNKNAFYELGYASALNKEIITVQNKNVEQKLFFDRTHIRSILYNPNDTATFQFDLKSTIESIRNRYWLALHYHFQQQICRPIYGTAPPHNAISGAYPPQQYITPSCVITIINPNLYQQTN